MIQPQEKRTSDLNKVFIEVCQECLLKDKTMMEEYYLLHIKELCEDLANTIKNGLEQLHSCQEKGLKGELCYLVISFLLSGVYSQESLLKLDFYDERYYRDPCDLDCYWDYSALFPSAIENKKKIIQRIKLKVTSVMDYEVEERMTSYRVGQSRLLEGIMKKMFQEESLKKTLALEAEKEVRIMYGPYLAGGMMIGTIERRVERE